MKKAGGVKRRSGTIFVTFAMSLTVFTTTVLAGGTRGELAELITLADAIVAVEILRTDYTAIASDGPMYGDARVLKVIKGRVADDTQLQFAASAWCGPTYKAGERRFLSARRVPPKITIEVAQKDGSALILSIKLINDSDRPLWLNPSNVMVSFEANNVRYFRDVEFPDEKQHAWIMMALAASITGTVRIASEEVRGTNQIVLWFSHRSVYFPHRSWAGTVQTAPVHVVK